MEKRKLPEGWTVVKSTNYPKRVYYFNKKTKQTSWEHPELEKDQTKEDEDDNQPPSPSAASSSSEIKNRPKLRAKRQLSSSASSTTTTINNDNQNTSKDTPQMIALRQRLAERKLKGNATKKGLIPPKIETQETKVERDPRKRDSQVNSRQSLTVQMKLLKEKIDARKSVGQKNKIGTTKQIDTTETDKMVPELNTTITTDDGQRVTRLRSKSMGAVLKTPEKVLQPSSTTTPQARRPPNSLSNRLHKEEAEEKTSLISPKPSAKQAPPTSGKKNTAHERMKKLRMSLNEKNEETIVADSTKEPEDPIDMKSIAKNAVSRSKRITQNYKNETRVKLQLKEATQNEDTTDNSTPSSSLVYELINSPEIYCEEMDWEPCQYEEVITEIEVVRNELGVEDIDMKMEKAIENSLDLTDSPSKSAIKKLYIVIDTNVFLSNLRVVAQVRDIEFRNYGNAIIVVPWTVLRELDYIKDDRNRTRSEALKFNARQAVDFLHKHFSTKHPRVVGQTPRDVSNNRDKFAADCPDDEILQTCLQIRETNNGVVLLSYDKNLCNKAMIHDMITIGRDDPLEKLDYLNIFDNHTSESLLTTSLSGNNDVYETRMTTVQKEALLAGEIYDEIKEILTEFLTIIVTSEMKNLFNVHWEKYVILQPPWTVKTVLKCAIKHWIAAVNASFKCTNSNAEKIIKELYEIVTRLEFNKINDVEYFIDLVWRLMQCLDKTKYPHFLINITSKMDDMREKCRDAVRKINLQYLKEQIGYENFEQKAEERANSAFGHFEKVYEYARDICGAACENMDMPCPIAYKKLNPPLSADEIRYRQPEIAAQIIRLLHILGIALEDVNGLNPAHNSVKMLHDTLESFYSIAFEDKNHNISPLDLYCCLTRKEDSFKAGIKQLSELSSQFARMASFKYK